MGNLYAGDAEPGRGILPTDRVVRGDTGSYVLFGLALVLITAGGFLTRQLRSFDTEVPDSLPDDLVGVQERRSRQTSG